MTSLAPQRISEVVEECCVDAAALNALLCRLSDADQQLDASHGSELLTAVRATRNAIRGIKEVVELEVKRLHL